MIVDAVDVYFRTLAPVDLFEVRVMGTSPGDTVLDTPIETTKKIKIDGLFSTDRNRIFQLMGTVDQTYDAALLTRNRIDITSRIESSGCIYEISKETPISIYASSPEWLYALRLKT